MILKLILDPSYLSSFPTEHIAASHLPSTFTEFPKKIQFHFLAGRLRQVLQMIIDQESVIGYMQRLDRCTTHHSFAHMRITSNNTTIVLDACYKPVPVTC